MRVLVTGSRSWTNRQQIEDYLLAMREEFGFIEIAHGASRGGGVDLFVQEIARDHDIPQTPFPVRASRDGNHRGAPLNRNKRMVVGFMPDIVIAFRAPGKSNGTDFTVDYARKMGYPVEIIHEEGS